jgi:uncharacterized membrane protein
LTSVLVRAALLGLATGGRNSSGFAALAVSARSGSEPAWLARPWVQAGATVAAAGELVVDKLPATGSRIEPASLALRVLGGGWFGVLLARRSVEPAVGPAVAGAAGALAGSMLGRSWRGFVARRGRPDLPAALAEDVVVLGLAGVAVR